MWRWPRVLMMNIFAQFANQPLFWLTKMARKKNPNVNVFQVWVIPGLFYFQIGQTNNNLL